MWLYGFEEQWKLHVEALERETSGNLVPRMWPRFVPAAKRLAST
jgi:hypothetical protein